MKIKIEEFWKAGRYHYLDAVIIRDINTWDYQQFVYDEETRRFTKEQFVYDEETRRFTKE